MFRLSNLVMIQRSNIGMALLSIVTTQVTALSLVMIVGQMTAKMPGIGMILGPVRLVPGYYEALNPRRL